MGLVAHLALLQKSGRCCPRGDHCGSALLALLAHVKLRKVARVLGAVAPCRGSAALPWLDVGAANRLGDATGLRLQNCGEAFRSRTGRLDANAGQLPDQVGLAQRR